MSQANQRYGGYETRPVSMTVINRGHVE